jgi:hypothetical protein
LFHRLGNRTHSVPRAATKACDKAPAAFSEAAGMTLDVFVKLRERQGQILSFSNIKYFD